MTDTVLMNINPIEVREEEVKQAIEGMGYSVIRTDLSFR